VNTPGLEYQAHVARLVGMTSCYCTHYASTLIKYIQPNRTQRNNEYTRILNRG